MEPAVEPITIRGPYLWKGKDRFLVRGVVYQIYDYGPERGMSGGWPTDPIADDRLPQLRHDVALFRELGVNTIFAYHIDNSKSHTEAMKMLEEAGIYVLAVSFTASLDPYSLLTYSTTQKISTPRMCIIRNTPYESYKAETMNSFFQTVDIMTQYPNVLGILAAHLLINNDASKYCAPVISAVVRDLKRYMKLRNDIFGQRILPVGYGGATTNDRDRAVVNYLSSGDDQHRIDFWTCTGYSLGGRSGTEESDYKNLVETYGSARLPMFFSEYGGVARRPRLFEETLALYSPQMTKIFSGGCVYEFWYRTNGYGLVHMRPSTDDSTSADPALILDHTRQTDQGTLLVFKDFENYKARLHATRETEPNSDGAETGKEDATMAARDQSQTSLQHTLTDIGQIPESCVNWTEIEKATRSTL